MHDKGNTLLSVDQFKAEIQKFIGIPYRRGGMDYKGIDCSGLIKRIYLKLFGIEMPHSSYQQSRLAFLETVPGGHFKTGDLVFFGPRRKRINHVGVYLSDGNFLHAGRRSGVTISSLNTGYWKSRFIVSKRIKDLQLSDDFKENSNPDTLANIMVFDPESPADTTQIFELSYQTRLGESGIQLNTGAFAMISAGEDDLPDISNASWADDPGFPDTSGEINYRLGLGVAATLRPFEWMWVMPSWSYIDGRENDPFSEDGRELFGLKTGMHFPESPWSLTLEGRSARPSNLADWRPERSSESSFRDVSVGVHYSLSDSLRFMVSATRQWTQDSPVESDSKKSDSQLEDIYFRLNFSF